MSDGAISLTRLKRLGVQWGISQPMKQNAGKAKPSKSLCLAET
jgi:hypothetical protein